MTRWYAVASMASAVAVVAVVVAGAGGPLRVALALWFLLTAAGLALVPLLPDVPRGSFAPLVVAVSLAVDTLVVTAQMAVGDYSRDVSLVVLVGICAAGAARQSGRDQRQTEIHVY